MEKKLRGVIPIDLVERKVQWYLLDKVERKRLFLSVLKRDEIGCSLFATTMFEQPSKFPNWNLLGWGIWAKSIPWGWRQMREYWLTNKIEKPEGYIIVKEGFGKMYAVLFTFKNLNHFLVNAKKIWEIRQILTPEDYGAKWAGRKLSKTEKEIWWKHYKYFKE